MFFITQILAMIEYGPINVSKNIILLSNFAVASIAKMIGTEFSAWLWKNGNGLEFLSCIWLCTNIIGAACYAILYKIKDQRIDYIPIKDPATDKNVNNTNDYQHTQHTQQPIASTVVNINDGRHDKNNEKSAM